nr:polysaccharide deacetylase family protein [Streptomyces sp. SID8354]
MPAAPSSSHAAQSSSTAAGPSDPGSASAAGLSNGFTVSNALQFATQDGGKSVALTFDDGPDPRWTPKVLALLAQHHAKATFCEIGPNAQHHPDLTKAIVAAGDRLCDHSVHHNERQSSMPLDYNIHEIADAQRQISDAAGPGAKLWYYRAPGGDFKPVIRDIAAQHGLRPIAWSDDSDDWKRPGVAGILQNINRNLHPGSIILMHDGGGDRSQTITALAKLLDQLDSQGYTYSFPAR